MGPSQKPQTICLREIFFSAALSAGQLSGRLQVFARQNPICRTVLYVIIVILEIFAGQLSDRIKYFVSQNEFLLVLTDRPALFAKTAILKISYTHYIYRTTKNFRKPTISICKNIDLDQFSRRHAVPSSTLQR